MAYNNYFPMGYQQYYPQQTNMMQQQNSQAPQQNNSIIWVQGEAGAKSYLVAPNQTVTLWDTESQTIYVKSADASGIPNMRVMDYTMREDTAYTAKIPPQSGFATKDDLAYIKEEIEALKAKIGEETK